MDHFLKLIAIGLLQQEKIVQEGKAQPITLLNEYIRQGWEQLCYHCFSIGKLPPQTLPEFVKWLHTPVNQWSIGVDYELPLLEEGYPGALCVQLGEAYAHTFNPRLELEDEKFRQLYQCCRELNLPEDYTRAREFINRNGFVADFYGGFENNWHLEVALLLQNCYERIPSKCLRYEGDQPYIYLCPHCGWVLEWNNRGEASCHEDGVCADEIGDLGELAKPHPFINGMARTTAGVQRYVAAPEVTLIKLYDELRQEWGLNCQLYPHLDAYDLLIEFPSGRRWAVDVKDYRRAAGLAVRLERFNYIPAWDRAFYVFPDYRAKPAYLNEFKNYWKAEKDVAFMRCSDFVNEVEKEFKR